MRELACGLMEAGADFSDGLCLGFSPKKRRISPMPDRDAIAIEASDAGTAAGLRPSPGAWTAREIISTWIFAIISINK
jgi:hypothetical protein